MDGPEHVKIEGTEAIPQEVPAPNIAGALTKSNPKKETDGPQETKKPGPHRQKPSRRPAKKNAKKPGSKGKVVSSSNKPRERGGSSNQARTVTREQDDATPFFAPTTHEKAHKKMRAAYRRSEHGRSRRCVVQTICRCDSGGGELDVTRPSLLVHGKLHSFHN